MQVRITPEGSDRLHAYQEGCDDDPVCRHAAVIDPESDADIDRLLAAMADVPITMGPFVRAKMQKALREYANPTPQPRWTPGDVVMVWNDRARTTDPITLTRRAEGWRSDRSAGQPWKDSDVEDVLASRGTQHFRVGLVLREQKAGVNP